MRRELTWTFLLLLACPVAAQPTGAVEVEEMSASGSVQFEARFAGAEFLQSLQGTGMGGWIIESGQITGVYETVEDTLYAAGTYGRTGNPAERRSIEWKDASARFFPGTDSGYILLVPDEALLSVASETLALQPRGTGRIEEPPKYADQAPPRTASWRDVVELSTKDAYATVTGSFEIAVWGPRVRVQEAGGGSDTLPTGRHGGDSSQVGFVDESWLYLSVSNGTLTMPRVDLEAGTLFVFPQASVMDVDGTLALDGAQGRIAGHTVSAPSDVDVVGELRLVDMEVQNGRLHFRVEGEPRSMTVASQYVALSGDAAPSWLWWGAALALAATAGILWRRRPTLERLHRDLAYGRYARVLRDGSRRLSGPYDTPARIAVSIALVRSGRPAEALRTVRDGQVPDGPRALVEAHALSLLGREAEARRLLGGVLRQAPHLEAEVRCNPALARLCGTAATGGYA